MTRHHSNRNFKPQKFKRVENKKKKIVHDIPQIDREIFDKRFRNKIRFVSRSPRYIFTRVTGETLDKSFGVYTQRFIPPNILYEPVERAFPEGCKIDFYQPYRFTHSFDVRLASPITWGAFQRRIVKALEDLI